MSPLVNILLLTLCSNYKTNSSMTSFNCILTTDEQMKENALQGKTLSLATFDDMPFSGIDETGKELKGKGIAFEIINTLREKFGFSVRLTKMPPIVGDSTSGVLGKLSAGEIDMVASFLPVLPDSHDYVTWGMDMWQADYHVLLKRPADANSGSGLLAPFDIPVWILILISLLAVGPIMYGVMWLRATLCPYDSVKVYPLPSCVWFVYGALMKQGSTLNPSTDSARMVFATWWLFILILTSFYTANLTAFLTLSISQLPIKEIGDVAKDNNKWFAVQGGSVEHAIRDQSDTSLQKLRSTLGTSRAFFMETKKETAIFQRLQDGWMFLEDKYTLTRIMYDDYRMNAEKGIEENKRCSFVLSDKDFLVRSQSFAYKRNSFLPDLFNPVIERFLESGILQHLTKVDLPDAVICPLNLKNKERKLRNSDLLTTYIVVLSGFTCALAVFLGEIIWRCYFNDAARTSKKSQFTGSGIFKSKIGANSFLPESKDHVATRVNGRDYFMITMKGGNKRLIPLRTPSALLFQYA